MSSAGQSGDRVEREILIEAPIERVWDLVSEPGWWIGDGDPANRTITKEEELVVVDYPPHGRFPVLQQSSDAPRHVAFRSAFPGQATEEGTSTLVEFFLTEKGGGTLLRVVESGFASLSIPAERRAAAIEDNIEGWEQQLGYAKRDSESAGGR